MAEIKEGNRVVTQITTVKLTPEKQDEVVNLMTETRTLHGHAAGFVSVALHRSKDGSHVVHLPAVARRRIAGVPQEVAAIWKNCRRD
jgi:hypothetical protein